MNWHNTDLIYPIYKSRVGFVFVLFLFFFKHELSLICESGVTVLVHTYQKDK